MNRGKRAAILLGLVAALALPIVGNQQITLEMMYGNRIGSDAFWAWLDVRDLNIERPQGDFTPRYESSNWWWWRSSRPINEYSLAGQSVQGLGTHRRIPQLQLRSRRYAPARNGATICVFKHCRCTHVVA